MLATKGLYSTDSTAVKFGKEDKVITKLVTILTSTTLHEIIHAFLSFFELLCFNVCSWQFNLFC